MLLLHVSGTRQKAVWWRHVVALFTPQLCLRHEPGFSSGREQGVKGHEVAARSPMLDILTDMTSQKIWHWIQLHTLGVISPFLFHFTNKTSTQVGRKHTQRGNAQLWVQRTTVTLTRTKHAQWTQRGLAIGTAKAGSWRSKQGCWLST